MEHEDGKDAPPWQPGDRLVLDDGRREVVVEDVGSGWVCCKWNAGGIPRRSWIRAERLRRRGDADDRVIVIS